LQNIPPIWRYEGNGQLAAGSGSTVGYDYTRRDGGDLGNIYFVRSTDNGKTWSAPVKLNDDSGSRAQWMPALAETSAGHLVATWYDRRNTTNDDYQRFASVSIDGGVTWGPNEKVSDVTIKQPKQPDPFVQACYAGDYNLDFAKSTSVLDAWTDGRVAISGTNQQDVFYDTLPAG
jgi:Neuraminidase (sialidase)